MIIYSTKDGDVLDSIYHKYYGSSDSALASGIIEEVLKANRHLANLDAVFSANVKIILPDLSPKAETESIRLWS